MKGVNKAIVIGNVGADPEIRNFDNGGKVASFSLATSDKYKDKNGEMQTETEWHRISAFNKVADIVEMYVKKGDKLFIEGKLKTRSWEDKDGVTKYTTEIIMRDLVMLGSKGEGTTGDANKTETAGPIDAPQPEKVGKDGLPF